MDVARVRRLLELNEGRRRKMYRCTAGFNTIGVGHNLDANPISDRAVDVIFEDDLADVTSELDRVLPWWREHDEVRQAALIDLMFNLGASRLLGFKNTLAAFRNKVYDAAAIGLRQSKWFTQVGVRGPRIVDMVSTGEWPKGL